MRHETVWLDRTIDRNFIKTGRLVRETTAAVMIEKYHIKLTFLLFFASFCFSFPYSSLILCYSYDEGYRMIIDQIDGAERYHISSSSSSSNNLQRQGYRMQQQTRRVTVRNRK